MPPLLELKGVTKIFGGGFFDRSKTVALENFSMSFGSDKPSITALIGESGSGKTTMAQLMLGLIPPTHGEVLYKGNNVQNLSRSQRKEFRKDLQVVFQDPFEVFNPFYKVDHALLLPIRKLKLANSRAATKSLVEETISAVGLRPEDTLGRYPHQLSGGQRQRVMVARAILMRPKLIIADEPVSMLDASLRATVLENLQSLHDQYGIEILYITHDLTTAYEISQNIIVLYKGRVAEAGDIDAVAQDPSHPYTRMLINAIPLPDPDRKWNENIQKDDVYSVENSNRERCVFSDLCEFVTPECTQSPPSIYRISEKKAANCYLYKEFPVVSLSEVVAKTLR